MEDRARDLRAFAKVVISDYLEPVMRHHQFGNLMCLLLLICGCSVQQPVQWKEWRDQFVLKDKPTGAITIAEAIANPTMEEVVVVAQIGGGRGDLFDNKIASFLVTEAPDEAHQGKPGHDPDGCPFCKQKLANAPTVTVGFSTSQGKAIPVDARKLFGLNKGDIVVIRGTSTYEESMRILNIIASGIHVVSR